MTAAMELHLRVGWRRRSSRCLVKEDLRRSTISSTLQIYKNTDIMRRVERARQDSRGRRQQVKRSNYRYEGSPTRPHKNDDPIQSDGPSPLLKINK